MLSRPRLHLPRAQELLLEFRQRLLDLAFQRVIQRLLLHDRAQQLRIRRIYILVEFHLERLHIFDARSSRNPLVPAKMMRICFENGSG